MDLLFSCLPEEAEILSIEISRNHCYEDLINLYKDEEILNKKLNVTFIGELGVDGGGLSKEMFNIFFDKCEGIFFHGEDCLVPYLELNKYNEVNKFVVIGKILQHMLLLTRTIPCKISTITLMLIANPDTTIVDSTIVLRELLLFVNPYLRKILKKSLISFNSLTEKEIEVIYDFYQSNRFFARPTSDSISEQLRIIGSNILIEKPGRLIGKIREGVLTEKYSKFWNNCNFQVFLNMQTPTADKVVKCLLTEPNLTNEENDILHYFTMYIHCLEKERLRNLLFLITGSSGMPALISVKFNDFVGLSQRPTFSTCTNTITLPKSYANYNELKNDLNTCLNMEEAKEYTAF